MTVSLYGQISALAQKEWIKLRLFGAIPFILALVLCTDFYLTLKTIMAVHGAAPTMQGIIFKEQVFFDRFTWFFSIAGLFFASLQIMPECIQGRLRLALHMPTSPRLVLAVPVVVGLTLQVLLGLVAFIGLTVACTQLNFPWEVTVPMISTVLPWIIAGIVAWCATAAAIADPSYIRKVMMLLFGLGYISMLTTSRGWNDMEESLWIYTLVSLPWTATYYISALRIKG
ncbi:MAG: hypothetical protein IJ022_02320 [Burkholderiaceae bacterium]|nr:hypothetical protein [Burkholderiaceae bacterium]